MISYIIASYAGMNHESNQELRNIVLCKVFEQFLKLLQTKEEQGVPNLIHEVIVMVPPIGEDDTALPFYYMPQTWEKQLQRYSVTLRMVDYEGENKNHSYDQWIQGWLAASASSQYFLFSEDDYYLDSNPLLDVMLIEYYKKTFPNGIGYLTSYAADLFNYGYHAAISNGMISRTTLDRMTNVLKTFYDTTNTFSQLKFSEMFDTYNIPIKDYNDTYSVLYWSAYRGRLELYGTEHPQHVFIPVQYLYFPEITTLKKAP